MENHNIESMQQDEIPAKELKLQTEDNLYHELENDEMNEQIRKRLVVRLFDRFRLEYTELSLKLRTSLSTQLNIMKKCTQVKNELTKGIQLINTIKQMQDEEMKNLKYYRQECEHAWKSAKYSDEREHDAIKLIDDLKLQIEQLQNQITTLVNISRPPDTNDRRLGSPLRPDTENFESNARSSYKGNKELIQFGNFTSQNAAEALEYKTSNLSDATEMRQKNYELPKSFRIISFEAWKLANCVYSISPSPNEQSIPSSKQLQVMERQQALARCLTVPTILPTALQRASSSLNSRAKTSPARKREVIKDNILSTTVKTQDKQKISKAKSKQSQLPRV